MTLVDLKRMVISALDKFICNEEYLLSNDVSERTISSQVANYLTAESDNFRDFRWSIDCEYNRHLDFPKQLIINNEHVRVIPDIIIHVRGENNYGNFSDNNLLVIEIKKNASVDNREYDLLKINGFIDQEPYNYKYGLFINFVDTNYELEWLIRQN